MKRRLPFEILYEDKRLLAIDKPCGLLTTHTRLQGRGAREAQATAENILNDYLRKGQWKSRLRVWLVHRLDRETSGVLLFAKDEALAAHLRDNWNSVATKTYLAWVEGCLKDASGEFKSYLRDDQRTFRVASVDNPDDGKFAHTQWRRLACGKSATLVEVNLKTGRKNQIRVHFSEAGHPVVGDVKYGARPSTRLMLHAWRLSIRDAVCGIELNLEAPPREMLKV